MLVIGSRRTSRRSDSANAAALDERHATAQLRVERHVDRRRWRTDRCGPRAEEHPAPVELLHPVVPRIRDVDYPAASMPKPWDREGACLLSRPCPISRGTRRRRRSAGYDGRPGRRRTRHRRGRRPLAGFWNSPSPVPVPPHCATNTPSASNPDTVGQLDGVDALSVGRRGDAVDIVERPRTVTESAPVAQQATERGRRGGGRGRSAKRGSRGGRRRGRGTRRRCRASLRQISPGPVHRRGRADRAVHVVTDGEHDRHAPLRRVVEVDAHALGPRLEPGPALQDGRLHVRRATRCEGVLVLVGRGTAVGSSRSARGQVERDVLVAADERGACRRRSAGSSRAGAAAGAWLSRSASPCPSRRPASGRAPGLRAGGPQPRQATAARPPAAARCAGPAPSERPPALLVPPGGTAGHPLCVRTAGPSGSPHRRAASAAQQRHPDRFTSRPAGSSSRFRRARLESPGAAHGVARLLATAALQDADSEPATRGRPAARSARANEAAARVSSLRPFRPAPADMPRVTTRQACPNARVILGGERLAGQAIEPRSCSHRQPRPPASSPGQVAPPGSVVVVTPGRVVVVTPGGVVVVTAPTRIGSLRAKTSGRLPKFGSGTTSLTSYHPFGRSAGIPSVTRAVARAAGPCPGQHVAGVAVRRAERVELHRVGAGRRRDARPARR